MHFVINGKSRSLINCILWSVPTTTINGHDVGTDEERVIIIYGDRECRGSAGRVKAIL